MDSSSRTETAGPVATTITKIPGGRPAADARHDPCWCGQDMDVVRGDHCPRCGTMRVARAGTVLPRLAA